VVLLQKLIDLSCRAAFDPLKDPAQFVGLDEPEDHVGMVGHHYGRIQIDARAVAGFDRGHDEIASPVRKLDPAVASEGYEVGSSWYLEMGEIAVGVGQLFGFPGIYRLESWGISDG